MTYISMLTIMFWIIAGLFILIFSALSVDATFRLYYSNILQIISAVLSALFCYRTAFILPKGNPMRIVWILLGTGLAAWGIGNIIYSLYPWLNQGQETPYPYYSDIGFLAFIPLVVGALLIFKKNLGIITPRWGVVLAILLLICGLYTSGISNWDGLSGEGWLPLVSVCYIFFDPFLLMTVMLVASGLLGGSAANAAWFILGGLLLYFVGNQIYTYMVLTEQYVSGSPIDAFWVFGFCMIAIAAMSTHSLFKGNR